MSHLTLYQTKDGVNSLREAVILHYYRYSVFSMSKGTQQRKECLSLLGEGFGLRTICEKKGWDYGQVDRLMRRADKTIGYSPIKNMARYRTAVTATKCRVLKNIGFTFEEIAREFSFTLKWVQHLYYMATTGAPTLHLLLTEDIQVKDQILKAGPIDLVCSSYCVVGSVIKDGTPYYVPLNKLKGRVKFQEGQRNKTE